MREKSPLKLELHLPDLKLLRTAAGNGLQEFVSNLSYVVAIWLYNRVFISHLGTAGVAALTMCSFTVYTFNCVFHGFCAASSPILGFKVGAKEPHQVRRVFLQSYALAGLLLWRPICSRFPLPAACWDSFPMKAAKRSNWQWSHSPSIHS